MTQRRALLAALLAAPTVARAQADYPARPVRLIVPFIPGSAPDINARQIAEQIGQRIGQTLVIENRAGAAGNLGFAYVAKQAAPDGYTLLWGTGGLVINPPLYGGRVNFDTLADFTPIALAFGMSCTVIVKADSPIRTLADLVAQLRRDPKTPYASGGFGTAAHLTAALFLAGTQTEAEHIPFRGAPDIINAVRSGTVAFGFPQTQVALPLIQAGQLRAIGVTTTASLAALPGVPTVAETVPGYEFLSWMGLLGPAGLPAPILGKIEKAAMETLADPAFRARISADGTSLIGLGAADFRTFLANDMARGREMVRVSGARIE